MSNEQFSTELKKIEGLYASELRNGLTLFFVSPAWLLLGVTLRNLLDNSGVAKAAVIFVMIGGILFSYLALYYVAGSFSVYNSRLRTILDAPKFSNKSPKRGILWRFRNHVSWAFLLIAFLFNIVLILIVILLGFDKPN
jgi:hypothetical protein